MGTKVTKGKLIVVENKERKFGSSEFYIAIQVENEDGGDERCLLFTKKEIKIAQARAAKNPEDLTKKGFFTRLFD